MKEQIDVLIVGGSFAGLSAAMGLGRARKKVVVVDSGKPCNRQTPHAHNLITHDGEKPGDIAATARKQLAAYPTVRLTEDFVTEVTGSDNQFDIFTASGRRYVARKVIFATGVKDLLPDLPGIHDCWGISVVHCPFCHGYEYADQKTGILVNGEGAVDFGKLIRNWTEQLTIFTNGPATFDQTARGMLLTMGVGIDERPIRSIQHENGVLEQLVFEDNTSETLTALYHRPAFEQHCPIPEKLGCKLTEMGHIEVNFSQQTSIPGIYAAGDATTGARSLSVAIAQGTMAAARLTHELLGGH